MSWWKREQQPEPEWESSPGQIEIYASHDNHCVTMCITRLGDETGEATTLSLPPELAYQIAQRITLAAIKIEEGESNGV